MRSQLPALFAVWLAVACCANVNAQRIQFPQNDGLRPIGGMQTGPLPTTGQPTMVPINPATQSGIVPQFDPYANAQQNRGIFGGPVLGAPVLPPTQPGFGQPGFGQSGVNNGLAPILPGTGQSGVVGTFQNNPATYGNPGLYPNNAPSALFPGGAPGVSGYQQNGSLFGGFFQNMFNGAFGQPGTYPPNGPIIGNGSPLQVPNTNWGQWNPPGAVFSGGAQMPGFVRLFQGPRFRHSFVYGNEDADALMINDSDASLAFAWPNFLFSTQPLYILPSFSLHQWDGPHPAATADLPALAYSAFLDTGWQSDPARILGAELGLRVGMFSDFDTANSDSLRVMGRGIARVRITPRATLKGGVIYLDRNKVKLLPAGGILWQPNPNTRLDIFFPEPKLASYLTTIGNTDTWWYTGGYYGGGAWTVTRADGTSDSIDINDLRIVVGLEFGKNEQMREGRRVGFVEFGFAFDRELLFDATPADNLSLQDTVMVRAGIGY